MRYQTLMHDLLFKETFADPHNRRQLEFFLEQILGYETGYLHNKLDVSYESPIKKNKLKDKSIRGDIIIKFEDVVVNMEAFTNFNGSSIDKSIYYIMRIHASKLKVGEDYHELGKTIQINFVENAHLGLGDELVYDFHLACDAIPEVKLLENSFCVKIVQIDKARELGYTNNILDKWLKFIAANGSSERDSVAKGDVLLMELNEWIKKYVADDETQEELNKWDIEIATNKGIELGKKEGLEQGKAEEKIEIAKELLKMKLNDEDIAKATGLTSNEIMQLKGAVGKLSD